MKDGWHIVKGEEVYIENNKVLRGIKYDNNGNPVPSYPYKRCRSGGYDNAVGVSYKTYYNGNYKLM